jgi:cytochrome P450 PksS
MADPFGETNQLRDQGPLVRVKLPIIGKVWVTTTQLALAAILKDTGNFSMRKSDGKVAGTQWWMPRSIFLLANNMLTMDEPDHTRLRHLVDKAFRRDFIMGMEPQIQQIADQMAGELLANNGEADLVTDFARRLPLAVICELLGLREQDRQLFSNWAANLTTVSGMFSFLRALGPIRKMSRFVGAEIERQRHQPENGLISELVAMQNAGENISDDEMIAMVFLLLIAGHETTTHVISGGIFELLGNREQRQYLLKDWERLPMAVEELLRHVSAVQFTKPRIARKDVMVEGVQVSKGDMVMAMIVAANGDSGVINNPAVLDLSRKPNRHVSFGAGPHFCLGHQLARLEIACAIKALFQKHPNLMLAGPASEIKWRSRVGLRVIEELRVRR